MPALQSNSIVQNGTMSPISLKIVEELLKRMRMKNVSEKIKPKLIPILKHCSQLMLENVVLKIVMELFNKEIERGLSKKIEYESSLKMLPSYVTSVPTGNEKGNYLALDLGGTNFRVLLIHLPYEGKNDMKSHIYSFPLHIMTGTGEALFDHIADCLAKFMKEHENELKGERLSLGFTFSFPCDQQSLTSGRLITWTKGFTATGVEGEDIVALLKKAINKRKDVDIDVVALLNDTTGTLMSCAYLKQNCNIGVIVGTGTNACYMEKLERCEKFLEEMQKQNGDGQMILNTEWGAFGDNGCLNDLHIQTKWDIDVDENSINPKKQTFEKMISGMYMGELVRRILITLYDLKLIFDGQKSSGQLETVNCFPTKFVSEIESDMTDDKHFVRTREIFGGLGVDDTSDHDCIVVGVVCYLVSTRAAHLCAAGIAQLINRMSKPQVTVGIDGGVYRFHPSFDEELLSKTRELVNEGLKFDIELSHDGSGRGAALVAAVASKK